MTLMKQGKTRNFDARIHLNDALELRVSVKGPAAPVPGRHGHGRGADLTVIKCRFYTFFYCTKFFFRVPVAESHEGLLQLAIQAILLVLIFPEPEVQGVNGHQLAATVHGTPVNRSAVLVIAFVPERVRVAAVVREPLETYEKLILSFVHN